MAQLAWGALWALVQLGLSGGCGGDEPARIEPDDVQVDAPDGLDGDGGADAVDAALDGPSDLDDALTPEDPTADAALDALDAEDSAELAGDVEAPRCPPVGPFGEGEGAIVPDVELLGCDGAPVRLHGFCGARATLVQVYTVWCPNRQGKAAQLQRIYEENEAQGGQVVLVITEDATFGEPDTETCAQVRDRFGLEFPVLFDPQQRLPAALGRSNYDEFVVFSEGMRVEWAAKSPSNSQFEEAFERVVAAP